MRDVGERERQMVGCRGATDTRDGGRGGSEGWHEKRRCSGVNEGTRPTQPGLAHEEICNV
jgi:hypothetical protein